MGVRERIKLGCIALGLTQVEIARRIGTQKQNVGHVASGAYRSGAIVEGVARELQCTVEWLIDGTGPGPAWSTELVVAETPAGEVTTSMPDQPARRTILDAPVSEDGEAPALDLVVVVTAGDGDLTQFEAVSQPRQLTFPDTWKIVQVFGKSAYPVLFPGQFAAIDVERACRPPFTDEQLIDLHDNIVLVQTEDGRGFLKRFCHAPGAPGNFMLASIDSGRSSPYVPPDQILVVAPMVMTIYIDPSLPREKRWHAKTVTPETPLLK